MVQTPSKLLTLGEFLKLPATEPASEYIDGRIVDGEWWMVDGDSRNS